MLSVFGRFNERGGGGCCPFSAGSASGGGGGAVRFGRFNERGGGAVRLRLRVEIKVFLDKRGGCKLQPPTNPPLHFLESIAFLATNLLCDNDCGYDNYVLHDIINLSARSSSNLFIFVRQLRIFFKITS